MQADELTRWTSWTHSEAQRVLYREGRPFPQFGHLPQRVTSATQSVVLGIARTGGTPWEQHVARGVIIEPRDWLKAPSLEALWGTFRGEEAYSPGFGRPVGDWITDRKRHGKDWASMLARTPGGPWTPWHMRPPYFDNGEPEIERQVHY